MLANGYSKGEWLTNKESVITESFNEETFETRIEKNVCFHRPGKKKKEIFKSPHILFKANLGENGLPIHYVDRYLIFLDKITGIHAPREEERELKQVYNWLKNNSDLLRFIISIISTQSGVTMSSKVLLSKDILDLPYPDRGEITLSLSEKVLIDDVLKFGINSKQVVANSPFEKLVKDIDLKLYGKLFCDALNPIYENEINKWFVYDYQINNKYTVYAFFYGPYDKRRMDIFDILSEKVSVEILKSNKNHIKYTRVLRKYLHISGFDILVLIKPSKIRYWLGSIALRDADETFSDLKKIGK